MSLSVVVRLSRTFWDDVRNVTAAEKLQFVMRQFPLMTVWCHISTLEMSHCDVKGQDTVRHEGVLVQ